MDFPIYFFFLFSECVGRHKFSDEEITEMQGHFKRLIERRRVPDDITMEGLLSRNPWMNKVGAIKIKNWVKTRIQAERNEERQRCVS